MFTNMHCDLNIQFHLFKGLKETQQKQEEKPRKNCWETHKKWNEKPNWNQFLTLTGVFFFYYFVKVMIHKIFFLLFFKKNKINSAIKLENVIQRYRKKSYLLIVDLSPSCKQFAECRVEYLSNL